MGDADATPAVGKKYSTELTDYSERPKEKSGPYAENLEVDVLVVGAGFSGIFMLKTLRERGLKTVIFEAGGNIGGTWRWNCYPGAAVDSEVPEYEFSFPEVWQTWSWTTNYPDYHEIRRYFDHVDKVLEVRKDVAFHTVVVGGQFDTSEGRWHIQTADGRTTKAKYLIAGTGFASRRYIPDWPGMDTFRGVIHHSSFWPDEHIDVRGKRCGVIGTGASGVQIVQAWGPVAKELLVFQRTPNLALPMRRRAITPAEQTPEFKALFYPPLFTLRERTFSGFRYDWMEKNTFDDSAEEREALYERMWQAGGFRYWVANYKDTLKDAKANRAAYDFWAAKTRARVGDPRLRDLLAPLEPPHYFGVKRPCLEATYFEQFNRPSVDLVDLRTNNIARFTPTGIEMQDGTHYALDTVAVATGFDVVTGAMTQLGLRNLAGQTLGEQWAKGADTYLGTMVRGFPNMFHLFGAHGPTLFSSGPSSLEVQGRWIADAITKMERQQIRYMQPTAAATGTWKKRIYERSDETLFPTVKSTYMGGTVPGKVFEPVCYAGGIPDYQDDIRKALNDMGGFEIVKTDGTVVVGRPRVAADAVNST
ncbi:steroid monooxygenase [Niveomyces insectorum RCEF 264]|uniref:Steroid monooxygenase n=1 Tax=Niveomyces insectorum RCEF 264 TaxID=1081102 RepID=A0A167W3K9_9HYPO|nr:steroid monooxygenase [Niveomyces insectorum RCEF 264]